MATALVDQRAGNLPVDLTSFVGRRRELAEVKGLLSTAHLVTLTGMGGVGKTRLALRAATDLHRGFADGVWLVELAGLRDAGMIGQEIAASLKFEDNSGDWSTTSLASMLASRELLLVLDNCEHLLQGCAVLVDALLRACPGVRVLATSRQPLGIAGEHTFAVSPLSVPGPEEVPSPEGLFQYESVRLFLERAKAIRPGFAVDHDNYTAVAGICRRLDGIPLAIELAAGRLRALSANELLSRLDNRFALLTGGSRAALPRQQTLQALIDWSFELCSPAERELWARLSVFGGAFDLAAAEEVCADGSMPAGTVLDLLTALVDKSIVMVRENDDGVRYLQPETLRQYGEGRLVESGHALAVHRRHRDRWLRLVALVESTWFGPNQLPYLTRLGIEHDDLRAVLNFCLTEPGESQAGLTIAGGLRFYWAAGRRPIEGRRWLEQLLCADQDPSPARVKALYVDSYLASLLRDSSAAVRLLDEADPLAEQLGDASGAAYIAQIRGLAALWATPERAAELSEQALAAHRKLGDEAAVVYDQTQLGMAVGLLGDGQRAMNLLEECLAITESRGEQWIRSLALWMSGVVACRQGDYQRATAAARQSLLFRLPMRDSFRVGLNLKLLAWAAAGGDDGNRAARLFGTAGAVAEALDASLLPPGHLSRMDEWFETKARAALGDGAFDQAYQQGAGLGFDEAVEYALGDGNHPSGRTAAKKRSGAWASPLTRRETEIAELITRGLSNKEIATTLVISQRTAEGHVEHILAKLGFTTRAQIAAWVTERRAATGQD